MKKPRLNLLLLFLWLSCPLWAMPLAEDVPARVTAMSDSIKKVYAPDSRTELYAPDFTVSGHHVMLRGLTTSPEAHEALLASLAGAHYEVLDCMKVLPVADELAQGYVRAVVNLSVCNLRVQPDFSAEMTSQALMGMPVKVLQFDTWYRIQTPDNYIAWVHPVGIHRMSEQDFDDWNRCEKVVVTSHFAMVRRLPEATSATVSDVVAGNRLRLLGTKGKYFHVGYPDGREGYLSKADATTLSDWRRALKRDAASLLATAQTMMGFPYLWAGTSSKGMDCSGFVRNIFYLHDMIIPRDASQQAYVGEHVDIASGFANLQPGDLLMFGRKATPQLRERVSHVGMYMGDGRFIHSQGDVHISSLKPGDELFDAFNLNRLLYAVRILPYINQQPGLNTTDRNPYYTE